MQHDDRTRAPEPDKLIEGARINGRVYSDPAIFELEMARLFGHAWIVLGHESQIPTPGCYFLGRVGRVAVIVTRDDEGVIRVVENRCAHRGPAVCAKRTGKVRRFVCPYHAWTYELDGRLVSVPLREEYGDSFAWAERGLQALPRVTTYRGFIFASLAADGPELAEFLGEEVQAFDDFMDRAPDDALEAVEPPLRYRVRANWKTIFENLNDILHPMFAHASAMAAFAATEDKERLHPLMKLLAAAPGPQMMKTFKQLDARMTTWGHSFITGLVSLANKEYPRDAYFEALAARRGEGEARRILNTDMHVSLLYPSATINSRFQTLRLVRPLAHDLTEVQAHVYRLKGAPDDVYPLALEYNYTSGSPASPVIVDDLEIYERLQAEAGASMWMSAERGLGDLRPGTNETRHAPGTSEEYIRQQYEVWGRYLRDGAR